MDSQPAGTTESSWWGRPAGGREVLTVAVPLVISSLSWTVMTFVDRMMLNWESGEAMAAAFSGGTVWFALLCFPLGVCTYASTFVSQYHGAHQPRMIGPITWQAVWVAVGFTPLVVLLIPFTESFFAAAKHAPGVMEQEVRYFRILCWGAPAMLISQALSGFYSGRGKTIVVMVVDCAFAIVNVVLDYFWIFGVAALPRLFPALGIEGAALATTVSLWLKTFTYVALVLLPRHHETYGTLTGLRLDAPLIRRLLKYGGPSGFQMLLDIAGFTVFVLLVGRLGALEYEATSMAFNVSTLAFMPIFGLSIATSILVGQHLGENRDDLAARATWTTVALAYLYMGVISALYVLAPGMFLFGFFAGEEFAPLGVALAKTPATDDAAVFDLAVTLLQFVAAYNFFDATLMIFAGAIKGAGDTHFVLRVSLVMTIALAAASWLAVETWRLGVFGCWGVITVWILVSGVVYFLRFLGGKWRAMRVIESGQPAVGSGQ